MAYEGHRSPPPFDGYPPFEYDPRSYQNMRQEPLAPPYPTEGRPRSRASSTARPDGLQQPQPVNEPMGYTLDRTDSANQVDPALVAHITAQVTEQVLNSLKATNLAGGAPMMQQQRQPPLPQPSYVPQSPTSSTSASFPARYTPPSPTRHEHASQRSDSPDRQPPEPDFFSRETPTPRYQQRERAPSPLTTDGSSATNTRPRVARMPTADEETIVEKMWQPLFDAQGQPTIRLGQFLRGLAVHIIQDYEPQNSIVVTPAKMLQFYNDVRLSDERYPWSTIFGKLTNESISRLYRDLKCQQHLVQKQFDEAPSIPGLTPIGFECWMTTMLQAHPDAEFERLGKAVQDMPINNVDDTKHPKERFPKILSRRLFPKYGDGQIQQRLVTAFTADPSVQLPRSPAFVPPAPVQSPVSSSFTERERNPYQSFSASAVDDSDEATPTAFPIERERKPYSAQPGQGKKRDDDINNTLKPDASTRHRASSVAHGQPAPQTTQSSSSHHRTGSNRHSRRTRSPSFTSAAASGSAFSRSDNAVGDIPSGYYTSNLYSDPDGYPPPPSSRSVYEDDYHRRRGTGGSDGYGSYGGGYPPPSTSRY
ncbi:hypothetical protein LTR04_003451 [Oleoguttula sp. CCFEE 6159]|nr:hypothetical protein LTR04_003451 [Oleoguttula sp. CCFEE 6159]